MSGYLGRGPLNTKSPHFDRLDIHGPLNGLYSKAVRCIATREGTNKEVSARVVSVARPSQRALGRGNAYSFDGPVIADVGVQKL